MGLEEQIAQTLLKKIAQIAEERHLSEKEIKNLIDVSVKAAFTDGIKAMSDGMVSRLVQQDTRNDRTRENTSDCL